MNKKGVAFRTIVIGAIAVLVLVLIIPTVLKAASKGEGTVGDFWGQLTSHKEDVLKLSDKQFKKLGDEEKYEGLSDSCSESSLGECSKGNVFDNPKILESLKSCKERSRKYSKPGVHERFLDEQDIDHRIFQCLIYIDPNEAVKSIDKCSATDSRLIELVEIYGEEGEGITAPEAYDKLKKAVNEICGEDTEENPYPKFIKEALAKLKKKADAIGSIEGVDDFKKSLRTTFEFLAQRNKKDAAKEIDVANKKGKELLSKDKIKIEFYFLKGMIYNYAGKGCNEIKSAFGVAKNKKNLIFNLGSFNDYLPEEESLNNREVSDIRQILFPSVDKERKIYIGPSVDYILAKCNFKDEEKKEERYKGYKDIINNYLSENNYYEFPFSEIRREFMDDCGKWTGASAGVGYVGGLGKDSVCTQDANNFAKKRGNGNDKGPWRCVMLDYEEGRKCASCFAVSSYKYYGKCEAYTGYSKDFSSDEFPADLKDDVSAFIGMWMYDGSNYPMCDLGNFGECHVDDLNCDNDPCGFGGSNKCKPSKYTDFKLQNNFDVCR